MTAFKSLALSAAVAACIITAPLAAHAQVSLNLGPAPVCPYGYYDTAPYACAPYGYYGPEWFTGGVFIGAGPWFHGPAGFRGYVDNHFHPDHGYRGALPARGERADPSRRFDHVENFRGNEMRDGQGHVGRGGRR
jgi:hypothetical protein